MRLGTPDPLFLSPSLLFGGCISALEKQMEVRGR